MLTIICVTITSLRMQFDCKHQLWLDTLGHRHKEEVREREKETHKQWRCPHIQSPREGFESRGSLISEKPKHQVPALHPIQWTSSRDAVGKGQSHSSRLERVCLASNFPSAPPGGLENTETVCQDDRGRIEGGFPIFTNWIWMNTWRRCIPTIICPALFTIWSNSSEFCNFPLTMLPLFGLWHCLVPNVESFLPGHRSHFPTLQQVLPHVYQFSGQTILFTNMVVDLETCKSSRFGDVWMLPPKSTDCNLIDEHRK